MVSDVISNRDRLESNLTVSPEEIQLAKTYLSDPTPLSASVLTMFPQPMPTPNSENPESLVDVRLFNEAGPIIVADPEGCQSPPVGRLINRISDKENIGSTPSYVKLPACTAISYKPEVLSAMMRQNPSGETNPISMPCSSATGSPDTPGCCMKNCAVRYPACVLSNSISIILLIKPIPIGITAS